MRTMDSAPIFSAEQIRVAEDLPAILKEYTKAVIRANPEDVVQFSAEYVCNGSSAGCGCSAAPAGLARLVWLARVPHVVVRRGSVVHGSRSACVCRGPRLPHCTPWRQFRSRASCSQQLKANSASLFFSHRRRYFKMKSSEGQDAPAPQADDA